MLEHHIRIIPEADGNESSIGHYNRNDLRATVAGDMWVCGSNSWGTIGYSIGGSGLNVCLNINTAGTVNIPYKITTPEINVNIIKSSNTISGLRIDDYVRITGNNAVDGSCSIGNNFSVVANSTFNGTVSVRTPSRTGGNLQILPSADGNQSSIGYYNRVDERSTTAGDMWVSGVNSWNYGGYSIGTPVLGMCFNISNTGATTVDYRLITPLLYAITIKASNATVITLQDDVNITGNLVVDGTITASNSKPFWVAGKVNGANLTTLSTMGRYGFTVSRAATFAAGVYYIDFNTDYSNANYIISLTNEASGWCKVWDITRPTAAGFYIVSYNASNVLQDSIFHFSVIA